MDDEPVQSWTPRPNSATWRSFAARSSDSNRNCSAARLNNGAVFVATHGG